MPSDKLKTDFDEICKSAIIPFFKDLGFKRKTLHFARQVNDITQCFNVQKDRWNSDNQLSFTFNFGFYNTEVSEIVINKKIQIDFPKTYDCFIENRLGKLSHKRDHWYALSKNIDATKTAQQIKHDLETFLKPMFTNYTSLQSLKTLLDNDEKHIRSSLSPYYLIAFYMLTEPEKGKRIIKEQYKNVLIPQTVTDTINLSYGRKETKTRTYINQHFIDGIERLAQKYQVEIDKSVVPPTNIPVLKAKQKWWKKLFGID